MNQIFHANLGVLHLPVPLKESSEAFSVPLKESDEPTRTEKNGIYAIQPVAQSLKWSWACKS